MNKLIAAFLLNILVVSNLIASENGIEISPFLQTAYKSFGYNYFNSEKGFELAVPIVITDNRVRGGSYVDATEIPGRTNSALNIDVIYRKHTLKSSTKITSQSYWYYGGVLRYSHLDGVLSENNPLGRQSRNNRRSTSKYGLGINLGYKNFFTMFDSSFYWGMSISYGKYVSGKSNVELENSSSGSFGYENTDFIDIEFAKLGYVF